MNDEKVNTYRVSIWAEDADTAIGNIFSDDNFINFKRISPIVIYVNMTASEAYKATRNINYEVVLANDWSI